LLPILNSSASFIMATMYRPALPAVWRTDGLTPISR